MSWREKAQERAESENDDPYLGTDHLADGQGMTLRFRGDGEQIESDEYGEGVRFPVVLVSTDNPDGCESNYGVEADDDAALVSWGARLPAALAEALPSDPEGTTVEIQKAGSGYSTEYTVEEV